MRVTRRRVSHVPLSSMLHVDQRVLQVTVYHTSLCVRDPWLLQFCVTGPCIIHVAACNRVGFYTSRRVTWPWVLHFTVCYRSLCACYTRRCVLRVPLKCYAVYSMEAYWSCRAIPYLHFAHKTRYKTRGRVSCILPRMYRILISTFNILCTLSVSPDLVLIPIVHILPLYTQKC